jgi:hypothetical protein
VTGDEDIDRIVLLATHDLGAARDAYEEAFGVSLKDKIIDAELDQRFQRAYREEKQTVALPLRLALALLLRRGKQGRLPVAKYVQRGDKLVVKRAQQRKDELEAEGKSATDADAEASEEVAAEDAQERDCPLSAEQILYALRHGGKLRRGKT